MPRHARRSLRAVAALVLTLAAADGATLGAHLVGGNHPTRVAAAATPLPPPVPPTPVAPPPVIQVPVSTVLAAPKGSILTYAAPAGPSTGRVGTWYGYPLVLPVIAQRAGWLEVRLPWRPNQATTWVRAADVTLSSTAYRIIVTLGSERLTVYRAGLPIMQFPVGIGVAATPTVTGHYFVAVHEPHGDPLYGPVVLDLSAHSDAIQSWEGMGDAIIAIHGPIDAAADAAIGVTGARVSNGCIRLHDVDLTRLSVIPTGTPVDVNA